MLKINPEKDIKELEKFGYYKGLDDGCHEAYIKDLGYGDYIAIYDDGRILIDIEDFCGSEEKILYDLIKADMVIKE